MTHQPPLVAIVGRQNVGKSTLFNRLVGRRSAIVSEEQGTTRDRLYGQVTWRGRALRVSDAGGFDFSKHPDQLGQQVQRHLRRIVEEADLLLIVCDAQQGLVALDLMIVERLRKVGKPLVLVANKADRRLVVPSDCYATGLEPIYAISALHGQGIAELLDDLVRRLPASPRQGAGSRGALDQPPVALAIIGRPNVGKSSLFNALVREERAIVTDQPGTTRDAIDTHLAVEGTPVVLIDTAGLKHRKKVKHLTEQFAMARSAEAITRCDVALLLLDGVQGVVRDDQALVERVRDAGRGLLILVNKWDLAERVSRRALVEVVHRRLPAAFFAPVLPISAKTGSGVRASCARALRVYRAMQAVPEAELSTRLRQAWTAHPPARVHGRPVRLRGVRWLGGRPPRMQVTTTPSAALSSQYRRYLLNRLARWERLIGMPVRLVAGPPAAKGR